MARIREYTQQFSTPTLEVGGRRASAEDFGAGEAMTQFGNTMQNTAAFLQRYEDNKQDTDAQVKFAESEQVWADRYDQLKKDAKPGVSVAAQLRSEMAEYYDEMRTNYTSPQAKRYIELNATKTTQKMFRDAALFDVDLNVRYKGEQREKLAFADQQAVRANPFDFDDRLNKMRAEAEAGIGVWQNDGDARLGVALQAELRKRENQLAMAAANGDIENPAFRSKLLPSGASGPAFPALVNGVLSREGGKFVPDDNGQGASKFGITQKNFPDVDVANLTREQAVSVYKRIWDAHSIDSIPPAVQGVVFDGVVNHGSAFSEKLKAAAVMGATKDELIKMRSDEYDRLAAANPDKYGKFLNGWKNRLASVAAENVAIEEQAPDPAEMPSYWNYLSDEQQTIVLNKAKALEKQDRSMADAARTRTINDHAAYIETTFKLPPNPLDPATIPDALQRTKYVSLLNAGSKLDGANLLPAEALIARVNELKPKDIDGQTPGAYAYQQTLYESAKNIAAGWLKERAKDPMAAAYTGGVNGVTPINSFDADKFAEQMMVRDPQAEAINGMWGTGYTPLMKAEAEGLKKHIDAMPVDALSGWLGTVRKSMSGEKFNSLMAQVSPNDGALLGATSKIATSISPTRDADAKAILLGRDIMQRQLKGDDKKINASFLITSNQAQEVFSQVMDGVQGVPASERDLLLEAAMAHYTGKMFSANSMGDMALKKNGVPVKANQDAFKKSIESVIGLPSKVGTTKVIRPDGMDDSTFRSRVDSLVKLQDPDMEFGSYGLVGMGDGMTYGVVIGGVQTDMTIDMRQYGAGYSNEGRSVSPFRKARQTPTENAADAYINRGFFGNLGAAITGGTMSTGGVE